MQNKKHILFFFDFHVMKIQTWEYIILLFAKCISEVCIIRETVF